MLFYSLGKNVRRNLDVIESSVGMQPAGVRRRSCVCCLCGQEEPFTAMNMERSKVTRSAAVDLSRGQHEATCLLEGCSNSNTQLGRTQWPLQLPWGDIAQN